MVCGWLFLSVQFSETSKCPKVEARHVAAVQYYDDADVFYIDFLFIVFNIINFFVCNFLWIQSDIKKQRSFLLVPLPCIEIHNKLTISW